MDTKEQNESPEKKIPATDTQAYAKDVNKNQTVENKKIDAKELDDAQLDDVAAAISTLFPVSPTHTGDCVPL